jgi:hypothetical protein
VIGFVTSHGFLDNPTLRGMRYSLIGSFQRVSILDMHGNVSRREHSPDGSPDENVFDIKKTGTAISLFVRSGVGSRYSVCVRDLWGDRAAHKYPWLIGNSVASARHEMVNPAPPFFLFAVEDVSAKEEYNQGYSIAEILPLHSKGLVTGRDAFVSDFESSPLLARMREFADPALTDQELIDRYDLNPSEWWNVADARRRMPSVGQHKAYLRRMLYRPFDIRVCFYHPAVFMSPRQPVMQHLRSGRRNLLLITSRMTKGEVFAHVTVSADLAEAILLSSKTSNNAMVFPLYLYSETGAGNRELDLGGGCRPAFTREFLSKVERVGGLKVLQAGRGDLRSTAGPEEPLNYVVSLLHAPSYRQRYQEFLKRDFPRIPLSANRDLFASLVCLGAELVALHLMESPKLDDFITTYTGPKDPEVGRVGWSDDTVWLDAAATKKGQPAKPGTIGFRGVLEPVWNFHIGGYQVCEKWLKDRKGRTLSDDDLAHYQKIVVALNETIRLMKEIDEVIERRGGWPGAFQTGDANAVTAEVTPFRPRIVEPKPEERYVTCVPLVPLKAAAGAFSDPQHVEETAVHSKRRLHSGMFVAQVVDKSMEPVIPDGAYCLFAAPVNGRLGRAPPLDHL